MLAVSGAGAVALIGAAWMLAVFSHLQLVLVAAYALLPLHGVVVFLAALVGGSAFVLLAAVTLEALPSTARRSLARATCCLRWPQTTGKLAALAPWPLRVFACRVLVARLLRSWARASPRYAKGRSAHCRRESLRSERPWYRLLRDPACAPGECGSGQTVPVCTACEHVSLSCAVAAAPGSIGIAGSRLFRLQK